VDDEDFGLDPGQDPFPEDLADVPAFFAANAPRNPYQLVWGLVFYAKGYEGYRDIPLENLVTRRSLDRWNLGALAAMLDGFGISSRTRYLTPTVAVVLLIEADEPRVIEGPTFVAGYMAYVEFDDGQGVWRVDRVGPPDEELERLRLQPDPRS